MFGTRSRRFGGRSIATIIAMWVIALNVALSPFCNCQQPALDTFGQPLCSHHSGSSDGQTHPGAPDGGGLCCQCCCASVAFIDTSPKLDLPVAVTWTRPPLVAVQILLPRLLRHPASPPRGPPLA